MSDSIKTISILRKSQPVDLEVEEGKQVRFFVKEMSGAQRDEYLNKTAQKSRLDEKGDVVGLKDYRGLYSNLLSFCLYDAEGKLVPESKIQEWPDAAQKALYEMANDINGMSKPDSEGAEGDEKN